MSYSVYLGVINRSSRGINLPLLACLFLLLLLLAFTDKPWYLFQFRIRSTSEITPFRQFVLLLGRGLGARSARLKACTYTGEHNKEQCWYTSIQTKNHSVRVVNTHILDSLSLLSAYLFTLQLRTVNVFESWVQTKFLVFQYLHVYVLFPVQILCSIHILWRGVHSASRLQAVEVSMKYMVLS